MCGCLLLHPLLGTWSATQACAQTTNPTGDLLVLKLALNPLTKPYQPGLLLKHFYLLNLFLREQMSSGSPSFKNGNPLISNNALLSRS